MGEQEVHEIAKTFCEKTTAHGLSQLVNSHSRYTRFFWKLIVSVATVGMSVQLFSTISIYLKYPYNLSTSMEEHFPIFPQVTICNLDSLSIMQKGNLDLHSKRELDNYYRMVKRIISGVRYQNDSLHLLNQLLSSAGHVANLPANLTRLLGHQNEDFIISCQFQGMECGSANFTRFLSAHHINCYTFTPDHKTFVTGTGPQIGLSLILYIENPSSMDTRSYTLDYNTDNAVGIHLLVQALGTMPLPATSGMDIPPGYSSSIALTMKRSKRLSQPYSHCTKDWFSHGSKYYRYSQGACLENCIQNIFIQNCSCKVSAFTDVVWEEYPYCLSLNGSNSDHILRQSNCELNTKAQIFNEYDSLSRYKACGCYPACDELRYNSKSSMSYWPQDAQVISFVQLYIACNEHQTHSHANTNLNNRVIRNATQRLCQMEKVILDMTSTQQDGTMSSGSTTSTDTPQGRSGQDSELPSDFLFERKDNILTSQEITNLSAWVHQNFIRVNIYFQYLEVKVNEQQPSYGGSDLLCNIGGTMGLWIGVSLITLTEFITFLVTLCHTVCKKTNVQTMVHKFNS